MLESLYGHSLVELGPSTVQVKPSLKFLGNNAKRIAILINNLHHTFLPEDQLFFLSKMLLACKMNTGDVAILNLANGATIEEVTGQLSPEKIISFGVNIPEACTPELTIGKLNGASFLNAPDLENLVKETDEAQVLKGRLWSSLKNLFGIQL